MVESPVTRWRSSTGIAADSSELKDSIPTKLLLPDNVGVPQSASAAAEIPPRQGSRTAPLGESLAGTRRQSIAVIPPVVDVVEGGRIGLERVS